MIKKREIIKYHLSKLLPYYFVYPHPFYNDVYQVLDLVIDFINPDNNKQLLIHVSNTISDYQFLDDDNTKDFDLNCLFDLITQSIPRIQNDITEYQMKMIHNEISVEEFISYCQKSNIDPNEYPSLKQSIEETRFMTTFNRYYQLVSEGKKRKNDVIEWLKKQKKDSPEYVNAINNIQIQIAKPSKLVEKAKLLKSKKCSLEEFRTLCKQQRIPPEEFEEYQNMIFEENWERKKKMIVKGRLSHLDVENWLEQNGKRTQKYLNELSKLVVEKKGKSLMKDVAERLMGDNELLKESETISSIDRAVKKCLIPREVGFEFIKNEIDIIHESVNIAIFLFSQQLMSLKDVDNCLDVNGCLTLQNIRKLSKYPIKQYTDMPVVEKWKRERKIDQALYDEFLRKVIK